ncbi:hypothetical protein [Bradyrhizobium sp. USDA 4369]
MSAAKAKVENREAAPAAIKDLTLRIGFVPSAGEAIGKRGPTSKLTFVQSHQMLKQRLTLIIKVDAS